MNPDNITELAGYVIAALTLFGRGIYHLIIGKTNVALEKVKFDKKKFDGLKKELENALAKIDELELDIESKEASIAQQNILIQEQKLAIKYSKMLLSMIHKLIAESDLSENSNALMMIEQVKEIFEKH